MSVLCGETLSVESQMTTHTWENLKLNVTFSSTFSIFKQEVVC